MRPYGTQQQLASRRQRALALLHKNQSTQQVARLIGATERSVRRWRQELKHPKCKSRVSQTPGHPSYLRPSQLRRLIDALQRGALHQGYAEDYWTLERIADLIWTLFRVRYRLPSVWHLMRRLGWSCQKPQRRALHRDDAAIAHWKHYIWPHIKKVATPWCDTRFSR
jgi:transposase